MRIMIAAVIGTVCAALAGAESANLKVVEEKGHISPVPIRVTYLNGQSRNTFLIGIGSQRGQSYMTHQLVVRTDGGASKRAFWLDSIQSIEGTANLRTLTDEFTVKLKDGQSVPAMFSGFGEFAVGGSCTGAEATQADWSCTVLVTQNQDDSMEKIDLRKVRNVQFLSRVRRDKAGNALFEPWHYSPFTGEKLQ